MAIAKDTAPPTRPSTQETPEEHALCALEERYRNELMSEQECCELRDLILKLRRKMETAAETVDAHHSCLEARPLPSSNL